MSIVPHWWKDAGDDYRATGQWFWEEEDKTNMSMMSKLKKNSKIKETAVLSESKFFNNTFVPTSVPAINIALAGDVDKGLTSGLTVIAGPSKHFKTSFALLMAADYLKQDDEAVLLFYDTEFGSPQAYFDSFGIDMDRVLHTPVKDVEELKFDLMSQLDNMERGDKVVIIIDSIGNIASKKELEDALNEKSVADMSRAKALKGLFRMVTPYLKTKDIPLLAINHIYKEIGMFPKSIVSGGTGIYYSADTIWIVGRQQEKKDNEVKGYHFVIRVEKSRFVKEGSKIPITVTWEQGILQWSGLLDMALAGGFVHKGKKGRSTGYSHIDQSTGEVEEKVYYEKETMNKEFWERVFNETKFKDFVRSQYQIGMDSPIDMDDIVVEDYEVGE